MAENHKCISTFFRQDIEHNDIQENIVKSLLRFPTSPTKSPDTSQELSQNSIEMDSEISLSQLTIQEPEPLEVQPFFNLTPREMPLSPHFVFEEELSANPWAMLVTTIFLTKTSAKIARPYISEFFIEYPTPYHVLNDSPSSLERFFYKLGLRKRGHMIWKLTYQFVSSKWRRASDLCGIGKYGEDAYRMFCLGHVDLDPTDRYLKLYLDWLRGHTDFAKDNSVTDCEFFIEDPVLKYYSITFRDAD